MEDIHMSYKKTFEGKCSIYMNTVGKVVLKADPEGKWEAKDADKLAKKMVDLAKANKAKVGFFEPEQPYGTKGYSAAILHKGGSPYMAILADTNKPSPQSRSRIVKLG
jgi:hypothetical protein